MASMKNQTVPTNAASSALGLGDGSALSAQMMQEELERKKKLMAAAGVNQSGYMNDPTTGGMGAASSALGLAGRRA